MMRIEDGHVYQDWLDCNERTWRQDGLVVSRKDLKTEIEYILSRSIEKVNITLCDPKFYVYGAEYALAHRQEGTYPEWDVDICSLRRCGQIRSLTLAGNILHGDVLEELPRLESLSIDNTEGHEKVYLQNLKLHTLYVQKPGRNVLGFERIACLRELALWNYSPKSRNLEELRALKELEKLTLIRPRIDTLAGIEFLIGLKTLEIHYARTLKDISALEERSNLRNVKMSHVPNVRDGEKYR